MMLPTETIKEAFRRYTSDPASRIQINSRRYQRIIHAHILTIDESRSATILTLQRSKKRSYASMVTDENGLHYSIKGRPFIRYKSDTYPECLQLDVIELEGNAEQIGDYLAPLPAGQISEADQ